ncbi:MAG: ABC transporter ATP-binding protein [Planctomycetota bacterium]
MEGLTQATEASAGPTADHPACEIKGLHHSYGDHVALDGFDLSIAARQITALLGPNGSGKTTLFRLLSTIMPVQQGSVRIAGFDPTRDPLAVRRRLGIVFQSPSLDKKLTVDENIACQAKLYGMSGRDLKRRRDEVLQRLGLADRRRERCENLSGGLKRRVEIAKSLLHRPSLMLLDEPSTGLDPAARRSLWACLEELTEQGTTVLLTTHLIEEADKADQVVIFSAGKKVAEGSPQALRGELGSGVITLVTADVDDAERILRDELKLAVQRTQDSLRVPADGSMELMTRMADRLGDDIQSISIGRPSLEDVFVARTGVSFEV